MLSLAMFQFKPHLHTPHTIKLELNLVLSVHCLLDFVFNTFLCQNPYVEGGDKWVMSNFRQTTILRPFFDIFERLPKTQNFFLAAKAAQ